MFKWLAFLAMALFMAACGDGESTVDAGEDVSVEDAGEDASVEDAGEDASVEDAGEDASVEDAGEDASVEDAGEDASVEDAGTDGGGDGGGDEGPEGPWAWCPDASAYVGDGDWPWEIVIPEGGVMYCAPFNEARTLEEELAMKARLWIPGGRYPVPAEAGDATFLLPLCVEFREPGSQPELAGPGFLEANPYESNGEITAHFHIEQPLLDAQNKPSWFVADISQQMGTSGTVIDCINGEHPGFEGTGYWGATLCDDASQCWSGFHFDDCNFEGYPDNRHRMEFDGGWVELHLHLGYSMAGTEPGIFLWAEGELDGVAFEQRDYFQLIYNPAHHHFSRHFAVLFDNPIAGACGIRVEEVIPWPDQPLPTVSLCDCDLTVLSSRRVDSHDLQVIQ